MSFFTKNVWGQTIDLSDTYGTLTNYVWGTRNTGALPTYKRTLKETDTSSGDLYGESVAIGCGRIVVGAPSHDSSLTNTGAAYIYDYFSSTRIAKLEPGSYAKQYQYFGKSVAIGDGMILVGAPGASFQTADHPHYGKVHVYDLDGTSLFDIDPPALQNSSKFGSVVAIGCGVIAVGEVAWDGSSGNSDGIMHLFDYTGTLITTINPPTAASYNNFPSDISIGHGKIVVGHQFHDTTTNEVGIVYIFDLRGNLIKSILASDVGQNDKFGASVSIGSGKIVVGSPGWDGSSATAAGAVYIYDMYGNKESKIYTRIGSIYHGHSVAVKHGRILVGCDSLNTNTSVIEGRVMILDTDVPPGTSASDTHSSVIDFIDPNDTTNYPELDNDDADQEFGWSVAVGDGLMVIGERKGESGTSGISGGAVRVYGTEYAYTVEDAIDLSVRS